MSDDTTMLAEILGICGLNDPESLENFKEDTRTLAKKLVLYRPRMGLLVSVAMHGAAGVDEGDENITYKLINIAKASHALDVAASVMRDHLEDRRTDAAFLLQLQNDASKGPTTSQDQNGTAIAIAIIQTVLKVLSGDKQAVTILKNFQDHFGTPS